MPTLKKSIPFRLISSTIPDNTVLDFDLPPELEASEPPEARGLARDEVRLMVSYRSRNRVVHTQFRHIGEFLNPGDLLVINTSGTMNAALNATRSDGMPLELHLSTHLPADLWVVEARTLNGKATKPFYNIKAGERLQLPGGAEATLHMPYLHSQGDGPHRLWIATLNLPRPLPAYLEQHGFPIRYSYVKEGWPLAYYQNVYSTEKGSAEMPSAGRAFTPELITQLVARGLHEPCATHLSMLETLAGLEHLKITYREALQERYLWHEFGDVHLILP